MPVCYGPIDYSCSQTFQGAFFILNQLLTAQFHSLDKPIEHKKIPIYPPPPSAAKACREPLNTFRDIQIKQLDPTGARTRLFSRTNPEAARPGDILLVRPRSGDPFAGVCLSIRRRGIDTAILLRNQLTRVGVEMWYKVYSPNVQAIEVVQRRERRARRERLYYMRLPKHDAGSVEGIVTAYERRRRLMGLGGALQTTSTGGAKGGEAHVRQRKTKDRNKR